jgi:formate hydrogenlyase subunit 3/multisubunit Na+/H+ antiporter MnhD subunit
MTGHLIVLPIVLPLLAAAAMLLIEERRPSSC